MKLPPSEKIYEAWSALASGRFASKTSQDQPSGSATVISSSGNKQYEVRWEENIYFSTDPATWWQGYPGYPVLAVLMYRGILPWNPEIALPFANVQWEKINKKFSRNYSEALEQVFMDLNLPENENTRARTFAQETFDILTLLDIQLKRLVKSGNGRKKP